METLIFSLVEQTPTPSSQVPSADAWLTGPSGSGVEGCRSNEVHSLLVGLTRRRRQAILECVCLFGAIDSLHPNGPRQPSALQPPLPGLRGAAVLGPAMVCYSERSGVEG